MENYEYTRPPVNRNNGAKIKRLKRKNRSKSIWIGILIFIILLLIGVMGLAYAKYYKSNYKDPSFEYISMTEEASARAYVWLNKIEDIDLSYEDVKECMGSINLEIIKNPTDVKGEYTYQIAEGAYDYCVSQSKIGLEKAYYMALKNRIYNSGYEGEATDELVDRLMNETFGISVSEYLEKHNIKLIQDVNELDLKKMIETGNSNGEEVTDEGK